MKTCPGCGVRYKRPLANKVCGRCADRQRRRAGTDQGGACRQCRRPVRGVAKFCRDCWRDPSVRNKLNGKGECRTPHPVLDAICKARAEVYRERAERGEPLFEEAT